MSLFVVLPLDGSTKAMHLSAISNHLMEWAMTPSERNAKRINRETKLDERLAANATRTHPPVDRETRQQVRRQGRELDARIARRQAAEVRKLKQRNRPRVGQGVEEAREAARNSRGWFKRHENPSRGFKKSGRAA